MSLDVQLRNKKTKTPIIAPAITIHLIIPEICKKEELLLALLEQANIEQKSDQQVDSDNQQLALEMQREERENQEAARLRKVKADDAFRQCLVSHIYSSDRGSSGIPKICQNLANRLHI